VGAARSVEDEADPRPQQVDPEELMAVAEAGRLVAAGGALPDALRAQLGVVHALCGARTSFVVLDDTARQLLSVVASRGRADERVRAHALDEGALGRAFSSGAVVDDLDGFALGFARSGKPAGAVAVVGPKRRPRDATLSALAASFGAAMEVVQVHDELRQRKAELEQMTLTLKSLDRQRDEFLGRVSHELKTPLTTVKTYLALLRRRRMGELAVEQERALAIVDRNADRLLHLIDDLLLVSRLTVGQMSLQDKPFGLKALLEECWGVCQKDAARAGVSLRPIHAGEFFVRGDREHLRESILALLDNAIRYNRPGGSVDCTLASAGATARLEISDTGPGIPPEKRAALFEPFDPQSAVQVRRREPGSSLARVSQVVQLHGGSLAVRGGAEPDAGSVFTLTLPLFAGMVGPLDAHPAPAARQGGVLLVEDDDDCREGVQELLAAEGIDVAAVAKAQEAIEVLKRSRPALVLVDLRLREGDGRSVIRYIRATPGRSELPVFVMSGAVGEASSFRAEGPDRIDGFFEKPLNLPRVLSAIRAIVRGPESP